MCKSKLSRLSAHQTEVKLQAANTAVVRAFTAVLDAEKVGANITQHLIKLNDAGQLPGQAYTAFIFILPL